MAWNPDTIKDATVLGPIKARPFGWPRKTRPALTGPVPAAARFGGRDGRMLAARVEPKNGRQKSKKTGNFKPLVLVQFQPAVDNINGQPSGYAPLSYVSTNAYNLGIGAGALRVHNLLGGGCSMAILT